MRESTAVFLGFGAVAFGIVAVPVAFFFYGAHAMNQQQPNVDGAISRAFLAVDIDANGSAEPVRAIDGLLPLGLAGDAALRDLRDNGFDCSTADGGAVCLRNLRHGSSSESWTVTLSFDPAGRIASRSGITRVKSL